MQYLSCTKKPRKFFQCDQSPRNSAWVPGGFITAWVGSRPWHQPCGAGSAEMKGAGISGSWSLLLRFQGKAWDTRKSAGLESLWVPHDRVMCGERGEIQSCNGDPKIKKCR